MEKIKGLDSNGNPIYEDDLRTAGTMQEEYDKMMEAKSRLLDEDGMFPDDDKVNNPTHYQSMMGNINIDCITAMRAAFADAEVKSFCLLNSFKYLFRASSKGQNTDIHKAQWYLNKFLELGGYE